jgi:hypothetical protein
LDPIKRVALKGELNLTSLTSEIIKQQKSNPSLSEKRTVKRIQYESASLNASQNRRPSDVKIRVIDNIARSFNPDESIESGFGFKKDSFNYTQSIFKNH